MNFSSSKKMTSMQINQWLLENDPKLAGRATDPVGLSIFLTRREEKSCGFVSLDDKFEDGQSPHETLAAQGFEEIEVWRTKELGKEFELMLDILRNEGTIGLADLLGCSQRRVQQKLKQIYERQVGKNWHQKGLFNFFDADVGELEFDF